MQIDRDIPLPRRIAKRVRIGSLPLSDMKVGDSFHIPLETTEPELKRILHSLRVRLGRFAQKNPNFKFSSSRDDKGIRVWRVEA
jgi:hypothetical protein